MIVVVKNAVVTLIVVDALVTVASHTLSRNVPAGHEALFGRADTALLG